MSDTPGPNGGGIFCDPQLGCSDTIAGFDIKPDKVSGTLAGDVAWKLNPGLAYLVGGDLTVTRRGRLSLGPGIVVKMETAASDLFVDGTLAAEGSEAEPVVFTSFKDDTAGGDTNGDGAASVPAPGDWGQIRFNPGSRASRLDRSVVAHGASTASAAPGQVRSLFRKGIGIAGSVPVWSHFHDTRGLGLANALAALEAGCTRFDASLAGLGGCPFAPGATGNIATEDLVYMLERAGFDTGYDLDALIATARWIGDKIGRPAPSALSRAGGWPRG